MNKLVIFDQAGDLALGFWEGLLVKEFQRPFDLSGNASQCLQILRSLGVVMQESETSSLSTFPGRR